ncbi:translation initiation factor IF-2 subunit beta [archaeon]|nr:translation initiation factor IF-2 subunit beta [archaeon]
MILVTSFIKQDKESKNMKSYDDLLSKAYSELPELMQGDDRFTIEKVKGHLEGSKTVISNLKQIAKGLNRDPEHLLKYLLRETASAGKFRGDSAIFAAKIGAGTFNKKIKKYASEFVICSECGKPDSTLDVERGGISYLKCQACGVKKPVKSIK